MSKKRDREATYMSEARAASSLFPNIAPLHEDAPDFRFVAQSGVLGVEMTELCHEDERGEGARLSFVAPRAKELYMKMTDARPVSVSPALSNDANDMSVAQLATNLASFVHDHRSVLGSFSDYDELPKGFCYVGIFSPRSHEGTGDWMYFRSSHTTAAPRALLETVIAEKSAKLTEYRRYCDEVWLLIVSDQFLGPGELVVTDDLLASTFSFDFDRVLLFERQAGGSGRVVELRRALASVVTG